MQTWEGPGYMPKCYFFQCNQLHYEGIASGKKYSEKIEVHYRIDFFMVSCDIHIDSILQTQVMTMCPH